MAVEPASKFKALQEAIGRVPAGRWGVAVSGGADSVALLMLLSSRRDLGLHVIHLDHETREGASREDASFVADLSVRLGLPVRVATRHEVEGSLADLPANTSALFRQLRLALFSRAVKDHKLSGVLVAHHADDQIETVLLRLLRGVGYLGLTGMRPLTRVGHTILFRPLLSVRRWHLRAFLHDAGQPWREDASNDSDDYARNRVRRLLAHRPDLQACLMEVAARCQSSADWGQRHAPELEAKFSVQALSKLPDVLAETAAFAWLQRAGISSDAVSSLHIRAVVKMCSDSTSPSRHAAPKNLLVRRRGGHVWSERPSPA